MRTPSLAAVGLTSLVIIPLFLMMPGCGQNSNRVKQLEMQVAQLKAGGASTANEATNVVFKGKIAEKYEDSVE